MARLEQPVFRFYAHTLSGIYEILPYAYGCPHYTEIQIVLTFARDYDKEGKNTIGEFVPDFDTSSIAPHDIQHIKEAALATGRSIKFFLSIGGRDPRFPFAVNSDEKVDDWVSNATESLTKIVKDYHIDGIDVYYEYINNDALQYFPKSIEAVIRILRGGHHPIVTEASITISFPLIGIYAELYWQCPDLIDIIVFQCFTLPGSITTHQDLLDVFHNKLLPNHPRSRFIEKILVGYSDWPCDKGNVTPAIFVAMLAQLLRGGFLGFSMWHGNPVP